MTNRIVLVEDSQLQAMRLQYELSMHGYHVVVAHTGEQGMASIKVERPDAILLDVMLPDTDGYTLCRRLKADQELGNVPIFLLTSRSAHEATVAGLSVGADAYVPKDSDTVSNLVAIFQQLGIPGNTPDSREDAITSL
jgi:DNA-binding response OmpR family regulator